MSPTVFALAAFLVVAGAVGVTGALLLWLVPGIRRERFVVTAGVPESRSILRWNPARTWWQRLVEQVGQWTGPRKATNISLLVVLGIRPRWAEDSAGSAQHGGRERSRLARRAR